MPGPTPSTSGLLHVRGKPIATAPRGEVRPAFAHRPCLLLNRLPAACCAADRKRSLPSHKLGGLHRARLLEWFLRMSPAVVHSDSEPNGSVPPLRSAPSFPESLGHPHPTPRPPSLPGAHPYPYTCRTSSDAPL